ncbi:hypothetical protein ACHAQA_008768 [Verticillium albo-atrum]
MRSIAGDGSLRLSGVYQPLIRLITREPEYMQEPDAEHVRKRVTIMTFIEPLKLLAEKDILSNLVVGGVVYAVWSMVTASTTSLFKSAFGLSEALLGLAFLPNGFGTIVGSAMVGTLMTKDYRMAEEAYKQTHELPKGYKVPKNVPVDFPIERARLRHLPWIIGVFAVAVGAYGSSLAFPGLTARTGWIAVPLTLQFFIAAASNAVFALNQTLISDLCPGKGASATAINNLGAPASLDILSIGRTSNAAKYIAGAGLAGGSGIWWFSPAKDDVPRFESPPVEHLASEPGPSKDDVTRLISQGAYSILTKDIPGVTRYDGNQLVSNSPCEDGFVHGTFPSPWTEGGRLMAWAVFDGHAGWQTADLLEKQLVPFVRHGLCQVKPTTSQGPVSEADVQRAITKSFLSLDDAIMKAGTDAIQGPGSLQDKMTRLAPAYAGSCALLSLFDPATRQLHVACTGDSRAVLGQQRPDGTWEAIALSVDQTGSNEAEIARLNAEHPGEESIAKNGRVLGIMVSRAFGDGRWKWPLDVQKALRERFSGPGSLAPRYDVRTPPYLTAEPVVTTTKIDLSRPSFLIMATDGLWDTMTNQQAVDLVGKWLEPEAARKASGKPAPVYGPAEFKDGEFEWRFVEERTTVQDKNAAVHLVRNSQGGNHHELIAGRLAVGSPFSRRLRDDITVQVAFFGQ